MRAATYLRVSSREQVDGYSIPAQREACLRLITDNGWSLADEYCDSGESARTTDRPQFQALLDALTQESSIDVVVVHKLDRLARNLEDHVAVRSRLRQLGVRLVSVTEGLEDSASGMLVEGIMASIAEFYSANLAQEVKKGMTEKARSGGWPGPAPVGYKNLRLHGQGGRRGEAVIVADEVQAPLVQEAFQLYATGTWSILDLHAEMALRGLGRGKAPMARSKIADMLRNRVYIGRVVWDGVESQGIHEPLIDEALFNKVQEVFRIHDRAGVRVRRYPHYLRGTVFCGVCRSRMSSQTAKGRYTYFYCLGAHTKRTDCAQPYMREEALEHEVSDLYGLVQLSEEAAEECAAEINAELEARLAKHAGIAERCHRAIRALESQRDKLLRAYYADAITLQQLKTEQGRIEAERSVLERESAVTAEHIEAARKLTSSALKLASRLGVIGASSEKLRQSLNQALFSAVYVQDRAVVGYELEWPFGFMPKGHSASSNKDRTVELRGFEPLTP